MTQSEASPVTHHPPGAGADGSNAEARARARETGGSGDESAATERGHGRSPVARLARELRPPEPWTYRPAAPAAVYRYAKSGGWTGPTGPARRAGVWWCRLVALPVVVAAAYTAWLVARPSRALTAALVAALVWLAL